MARLRKTNLNSVLILNIFQIYFQQIKEIDFISFRIIENEIDFTLVPRMVLGIWSL